MKNIILADCKASEVESLAKGLCDATGQPFSVISSISNGSHNTKWQNLKRYAAYFSAPLHTFIHRNRYSIVLGWQQFYAINYAFYCRLFRVKKRPMIVVVNFTYKRKPGFIGKVYKKYMSYCCDSNYVDYFHVLSNQYAERCSKEMNIPMNKFIVTTFGIPDTSTQIYGSNPLGKPYILSIGRSNRDFDFLIKTWKNQALKNKTLVILSDTWKPSEQLPDNIIWKNNIVGEMSEIWFKYADVCIVPIDDGNIASGDTVLLKGMMHGRPTVITRPSTLAEMYIRNGENGLCIPKDDNLAAETIAKLLDNEDLMKKLGTAARKDFQDYFSRESLGRSIGKKINMDSRLQTLQN